MGADVEKFETQQLKQETMFSVGPYYFVQVGNLKKDVEKFANSNGY